MRSKHCFKKVVAGVLAGLLVLSGAGLYGGNVKAADKTEEEEVFHNGERPVPDDREWFAGGEIQGVKWDAYTNYYSESGIGPYNELVATITGDLDYVPSEYNAWPWKGVCNSIDMVTIDGGNFTNAAAMFYGFGDLFDVDISGLDTSQVTDMNNMFCGCSSIEKLDLSNLNTDKVENMSYMFYATPLAGLDLSKFNTTKVTNMNYMFSNCKKMKKLDLSSFNTTNVKEMACMFDGCESLETLNISSFVTTNSLTNINYMFRGCKALTSVDLSGFNTSSVDEMLSVFEDCESLTSLNLSSFDTTKVTIFQSMCEGCTSLTSLDISNFDLTALDNEDWFSVGHVLSGCYNLKVIKTPKVLSKVNYIALPKDEGENPIKYMNLAGKIREEEITDASDVYTRYEYPVESVSLSETTLKMTVNDTKKLSPIFTPKNASVKIVTWKSSNPKVVSVDAKGNLKALAKGTSTITVKTLDGGKTATCKVTVEEKKPDPKPEVKTIKMFRVYNPNSGEHFYTASAAEKDTLIKAGWNYEGYAWNAPEKSKTPVYRLYNENAGDHHYTVSEKEKNELIDAGWKYEGIGWYSDDEKKVPLYRVYNPNAVAGSHHYTVSEAEKNDLVKAGWKDEGIAWYGR